MINALYQKSSRVKLEVKEDDWLSTLISQGYENEGASILQLTLLLLSAEDSGGKLIIVY